MIAIYDVIVIGAGAAGLMCAAQAGQRGRKTLLLEHNNEIGKKILISGGGRCNFTNLYTGPSDYLSANEHFCKSALSRYTQYDFLKLVNDYSIPYHEKTLGQQFCDNSAQQIVTMLATECHKGRVTILTHSSIINIEKNVNGLFNVKCKDTYYQTQSLVIATGALSFPRLGATDFGYQIARQFNIQITSLRPGLTPFTFDKKTRAQYEELSGITLNATVSCNRKTFREGLLFTHKGLSGPVILQISSYWQAGQTIEINLLPDLNFVSYIQMQKQKRPKLQIRTALNEILPQRFVKMLCNQQNLNGCQLSNVSTYQLNKLCASLQPWCIVPAGDEGYRKAEVTLGGVDTNELSSKTMMSKKIERLYFIGEIVDVTGHLGGFNFQWAWASGYSAGQFV